jgi:hypothetical protein
MTARTLIADIREVRDLDRVPATRNESTDRTAAPPAHSPDPLYGHTDHYRLAVPTYPIEQFRG